MMSGPKRREIGHGKLAKRAMNAVIPKGDDFLTQCVWCLKSQNPMVQVQWQRFAAQACH